MTFLRSAALVMLAASVVSARTTLPTQPTNSNHSVVLLADGSDPGGDWFAPAPTVADGSDPGGDWFAPAPTVADGSDPGGDWFAPAPTVADGSDPGGDWFAPALSTVV